LEPRFRNVISNLERENEQLSKFDLKTASPNEENHVKQSASRFHKNAMLLISIYFTDKQQKDIQHKIEEITKKYAKDGAELKKKFIELKELSGKVAVDAKALAENFHKHFGTELV
jgi:hypothetical protein